MDYTDLIADLTKVQALHKEMTATRKRVFDQLKGVPPFPNQSVMQECRTKVLRGYSSDLTAGKLNDLLKEIKQYQS